MLKIYAKSPAQGGTLLTDHTKMVLNLGYSIAKSYPYKNEENLIELMVSLILHDIGKCSGHYQRIMKNNDILDSEDVESPLKLKKGEEFYYHNTISWAYAITCLNGIRGSIRNPYKHYPILSAILYHHTVKNDVSNKAGDIISSLNPADISAMNCFYIEMCEYVKNEFGIDILSNQDFTIVEEPSEMGISIAEENLFIDEDKCKSLGEYFNFISLSLKNRSILNYVDRAVSSRAYDNERILSNDEGYLNSICEKRLERDIIDYDLSLYDIDRLNFQIGVIERCFSNKEINTNVFCASAGFGKTLMGVLTYFKYRKKTLWILPTLSLCESTYKSVIDELESLKVSDKVSVALFYSNEFKKGSTNSDIIIMGIDALLGRLSSNHLTSLLFDALTANVIFDEFHDFIMKEPLFAGFINLLKTRKDYIGSNTFLLSATPFKLDSLIGCQNIKYWEDFPIYGGDIEIKMGVTEADTIDDAKFDVCENSITIYPTVESAQDKYIEVSKFNEGVKLIHSRFLPDDKKRNIEDVFSIYGKKSKTETKTPLIGTNIIGTGFNISAKTLNEYIISPQSTIQTIGRGSRFCEYSRISYNQIVSNLKSDAGIRKSIESRMSLSIRTQWVEELKKYEGKVITKNELYEIYRKFLKQYEKEWNLYVMDCFRYSSNNLTKIKYISGIYKKSEDAKLNRGYTYRGESTNFYATVKLNDGTYLEPIVCDINIRFKDETDPKSRFYFMLSNPNDCSFPNKNELKYRWGIRNNYEATFDKCLALSRSKGCPMLLDNFGYSSKIGLYIKK